jgi:hypothetical protein
VLAAYAAAGQRDAAAMLRDGRLALEAMGEDAPGLAREQMLVIMMLGALDEGGAARLAEIEREFGARVPAASNYGLARAYLLAWGDTARR